MNPMYCVAVNGKQFGPFTREQLAAQRPPAGSLLWREGMQSWLPPEHIPELAGVFRGPPPMPPIAPVVSVPAAGPPSRINELRPIAIWQRRLNIGFGIAVFIYICAYLFAAASAGPMDSDAAPVPPSPIASALAFLFMSAFLLAFSGFKAWTCFQLAQALKLQAAWAWGLGSAVCCVGDILLLLLSQKANAALTQAGVHVGFLGANLSQPALREPK